MKTYYVYILKCSDGLLYIGFTNDIARRLEEHQKGKSKSAFTYSRRPVELIFHQVFNIKKWSAKKKWALANGEFEMLQILAECRNATHHKYKD